MKLRDRCGVFIYERGPRSVPFIVDEQLKFPFQIGMDAVETARRLIRGEADETSDAVQGLMTVLRQQGLAEDGRSPAEVRASIRAAWKRDHDQGLAEAVSVAAERMPLFQKRISPSLRSFGNRFDRELWDRIPILSRAELRAAFPHGFIADAGERTDSIQGGEFAVVESSGTSGDERLRVLADLKRSDAVLIASRFMNRHLFPGEGLKQAVFTTLHCSGLMCAHDLPQMEMRVFHDEILTLLPPEDMTAPTVAEVNRTIREIKAHGANWLRVNPTYLALLTYKAIDHGIELPALRLITTGYEYASRIHRDLLASAWRCPVYSSYGVTELQGFGMVECEAGNLHVNDRYFHFELFRDGRPARPGELGRAVATTLRGRLPIIRYDIGDVFIGAHSDQECSCGSIYSEVGRFAGRARDTIVVPDGRILSTAEIDDAMSGAPGVRFYQLRREAPASYRLTVVPDVGADRGRVKDAAHAALSPLLGQGAALAVAPANSIFPERSGKFRLTASLVDSPPALVSTSAPEIDRSDFAPLS